MMCGYCMAWVQEGRSLWAARGSPLGTQMGRRVTGQGVGEGLDGGGALHIRGL